MKKRVLIGMSGGVDSSVAAALLKRQGYDVIGITMQLLPKDNEKHSACCNLDSISDAKRVAAKLGIPHYTINSRDPFEKNVIDYFVNSYLDGETPNPCVECNRYIKFEELAQKAKELNADYVATGHYCQKRKSPKTGKYILKKGKDLKKDQSYFLYMINEKELEHTLFPLGGYIKSEIRELAQKFGLLTANKPESQEICFVTQKNYKQFIENNLKEEKPKNGFIVDIKGTILGNHSGIHQFTIGQRKGLGINSNKPLFVVDINPSNNTVIVGEKDDLSIQELSLRQFSLVNPHEDIVGKSFTIKTRYQMTPIKGKVTSLKNNEAMIKLECPKSQISPGQSTVIYDKDRVIGGGIINKRLS